jgi:ubiquinone/menaquinone biosynthesis C-methylase UbiE
LRDHRAEVQTEFERVAGAFSERTKGRFDELDVVTFARVEPGETVAEIGAGTGVFLSLFEGVAGRLVAADLTHAMLNEALAAHPSIEAVVADGARLPLRQESIDLVTTAQTLHHVIEPIPVLKEMRRVMRRTGRVLVVDQISTESFEQTAVMNELDVIRDPSHAASRPPSAFRIMVQSAGLRIVDQRIVESQSALSKWMWPGEFPPERIDAVREFIERFGDQTGMGFRLAGDDWVFTRRRMMLLAERAGT